MVSAGGYGGAERRYESLDEEEKPKPPDWQRCGAIAKAPEDVEDATAFGESQLCLLQRVLAHMFGGFPVKSIPQMNRPDFGAIFR